MTALSIYKLPIVSAFIIFPIIAFLFTLPYLIYQYRKYGAIPLLRSIIIYSLILYLLCAYFLVILPLPSIEEVSKLNTQVVQLIPFHFVTNLLETSSFQWNELSSYLEIIKNPTFYVAAFNILLTLPFGVYLRYYFECKWYKILFYGFCLSLFFEITQLTGLYGIYPRAYRLFDVDDLILNTMGVMLGCLLTPLFTKVLPSRKELDEKSFKKGKQISLFRRALSYCIDFFFLVITIIIVSILTHNTKAADFSLFIAIIVYFLIIPLLTNGKTFGKMILKMQIVAKKDTKLKKVRVILRYLLSYILFFYQGIVINLLNQITTNNIVIETIKNGSIVLLKIYFWLNILVIIINIPKKKKEFLYEKLTKTENISTISYEEMENEELKINENAKAAEEIESEKKEKNKADQKEEEENIKAKK